MLHRPEITDELVEQIKETIENNPSWNRTRISQHLCELWDWKFPDGRPKDISCKDMLRLLDKKGKIQLPANVQTRKYMLCMPKYCTSFRRILYQF